MKKFLASTVGLFAFASAAQAEPFNGLYAGVEGGYDQYEIKSTNIAGTGISADGLSGNGIAGAVFAGYDLAFGDSVFAGLEAGISLSDASLSASDGVDRISVGAKESYGVSARLGAMINDSTALYARLGWENTRFKAVINATSDSERYNAFLYGAGIETRIGTNMSVRIEYNVADFGGNVDNSGIGIKNGRTRIGVAYRF